MGKARTAQKKVNELRYQFRWLNAWTRNAEKTALAVEKLARGHLRKILELNEPAQGRYSRYLSEISM